MFSQKNPHKTITTNSKFKIYPGTLGCVGEKYWCKKNFVREC